MLKEEMMKVVNMMNDEQIADLLRGYDAYSYEYGCDDNINGEVESALNRLIELSNNIKH